MESKKDETEQPAGQSESKSESTSESESKSESTSKSESIDEFSPWYFFVISLFLGPLLSFAIVVVKALSSMVRKTSVQSSGLSSPSSDSPDMSGSTTSSDAPSIRTEGSIFSESAKAHGSPVTKSKKAAGSAGGGLKSAAATTTLSPSKKDTIQLEGLSLRILQLQTKKQEAEKENHCRIEARTSVQSTASSSPFSDSPFMSGSTTSSDAASIRTDGPTPSGSKEFDGPTPSGSKESDGPTPSGSKESDGPTPPGPKKSEGSISPKSKKIKEAQAHGAIVTRSKKAAESAGGGLKSAAATASLSPSKQEAPSGILKNLLELGKQEEEKKKQEEEKKKKEEARRKEE